MIGQQRQTSKDCSTSQRVLCLALFVAIATTACATSHAVLSRRAHLARNDLVGLTRSQLEACAGPPINVQFSGNWEYLTYVSPPPPPEVKASRCVATFMMRAGYVENLDYSTPSGGLIQTSITECLSIVDPCLPKMPED